MCGCGEFPILGRHSGLGGWKEGRFRAVCCGAGGGGRTHNLRFRRPLLYPLSYARS